MLKGLNFNWPFIRVSLEGHSFLDLPKLNIRSRAEARQFLLAYGYDPEDPLAREEMWRIYFESVTFLKNQLLERGENIPEAFLRRGPASEIERLLMTASSLSEDAVWACAILRIMHIVSHLDNDVRSEHFRQARTQIFDRFDDYIQPITPRRWKFGKGTQSVELVRYIKKERKDRNSTLIKLLSKPGASVEDIYDRIGFRFVTETRLEAFRLLQLFFDLGVISAPNIHPGRSLNTILPVEVIQNLVDSTQAHVKDGRLSQRNAIKRLQRLEEMTFEPASGMRNPFSSYWYRAIQFTCRQLITVPDPTFQFWNQLQNDLSKVRGVSQALKKIPLMIREKKTFYYPFEVQIMDKPSYVESIGGRSRHREYKQRQRMMARSRVLRALMDD